MKAMTLFLAAALACVTMTSNAATTINNNNVQLQHRCDYDTEGRITARTAYAWNGEDWEPALRWMYTYTISGYTVELARYDRRNGCFDEPIAKTVYAFTAGNTVAYVSNYVRNDSTHAYELTGTMLTAHNGEETDDLIASNQ